MNTTLLRFLLSLIILAVTGTSYAQVYAPDDVPMPNLKAGHFVADPAGLLSAPVRARVDARLDSLAHATTAEVGVALVPDLGDMEVEEYANRLFERWGVGKKDNDNGVLFILSPDSRQVRIQTGYGAEGVMTDMICDYIIRHQVIPAMKNGDVDAAIDNATREITRVMSDPQYAEELRSALPTGATVESPVDSAELMAAVEGMAAIAFVVGGIVLIVIIFRNRKRPHAQKLIAMRSNIWVFVVLAVLSCGSGLIWLLWAWLRLRRLNRHMDPCPSCGNKNMRRLSAAESIQYLNPSAQTELRLGSKRHEVWKCPACHSTVVESFDNPSSIYSVCERCGTKAKHTVGRRTVRNATIFTDGEGVETMKCEHCHNQTSRKYVIPKKDRQLQMAALGAASVLSRRRGGGGGGGFGGGGFGGFGGGSSGGGGASGRW